MWSSGEINSFGRKSDSSMKCKLEYVKERQKHKEILRESHLKNFFLIILGNRVLNYNKVS